MPGPELARRRPAEGHAPTPPADGAAATARGADPRGTARPAAAAPAVFGAPPTDAVAAAARHGARLLLGGHPVLGDHPTQRAVDGFVEQAARALETLARSADPWT